MRFLIVKTSSIGDVIQSFPLISFLKKVHPNCVIDWVAEQKVASLLRAHPGIDRVLEIDTKGWKKNPIGSTKEISTTIQELRQYTYDALFDVQGNTKSAVVNLFAKARTKVGYSWDCLPEKPNHFSTNVHISVPSKGNIRSRYLQLVASHLGVEVPSHLEGVKLKLSPKEEISLERLKIQGSVRPRLMVCFGSHWKNKQLEEEQLIEFLQLLQDRLYCYYFFIFGNSEEKIIADRLERSFSTFGQTLGRMSLPLWQRFMGEVEGVISMDSAALHLCATTDTPSFSLFGPSVAEVYKPPGDHHYAVQGECPYGVVFDKRCPRLRTCSSGNCLRALSPQKLADQFMMFWMSRSKSTAVSTS